MLEILFSWLSIPRTIGIWIDSIAFSLVDNVYDLIYEFASLSFFKESTILTIMNNTYIAISIFALFRIALILVNAMINPDKLSDKENGIGSVLRNLVIMFVLLIFTPLLFREAYYIQSKVVAGNYIDKIFLPNKAESASPGMEMKKIAMGALIHPDEIFASYDPTTGVYTPKDTCTGKCETAVNDYNTMMQGDGKGMFSVFTKHIGRSQKVDEDGDGEKETVYVYTYMFIVTLVVGVFITYILFTFGLDIAIRAVELAVLQMIAPLFIVTYIDPKSAKTGPFHNWLKTVGKTYASLFIKLAILSLMIMFVSLIDQVEISDNVGFIGKLVVLLAILIFAKKAPKWIGEMIGVDGEASGLGGLGKKIGSAALVGGALTAGGHAIAGAARGAAGLMHRNAQDRRAQRKKIREDNNLTHGKQGRQTRQGYSGGYFSQRKQLHAARKAAYRDGGVNLTGKGGLKNVLGKPLGAAATGVIIGGKVGLNASDLKGALKDSKVAAQDKASHLAFQKPETKFGKFVRDIPDKIERNAFGDPNDLYKRRKDIEDAKNAKFHSGGKYQAGLGEGKIVEGNKDAAELFKNYGAAAPGEHMLAQYCETNGLGKDVFDALKGGIVKMGDGSFSCEIDGKNVNLDKSLYVSGTGGAETLGKMFNTYQSNALANSSHSQEQYMQQVSTYQSILNTQNATAQQAQALATALSKSLPDALKNVTIDASSMSGVKKAINDLTTNLANVSGDEQTVLREKLNELSKLTKNYDDSDVQLDTVKTSMDKLKATVDELKPIVEAIEGKTQTAKEQTLSIDLSKYDKILEGIKKPSEEKK